MQIQSIYLLDVIKGSSDYVLHRKRNYSSVWIYKKWPIPDELHLRFDVKIQAIPWKAVLDLWPQERLI